MLKRLVTAITIVVLMGGAIEAAGAQTKPATVADSGTFLVLHGADTAARETFSRTATELRGQLRLADAAHGVQQYLAVIAPDNTVPVIEVTVREDSDSGVDKGQIVQRARVIFKEDSAAVDALTDRGIETHLFGTQRGAIPYLNLSFALLEQTVRRARAMPAGVTEVPLFNLGGGETAVAKLTPVSSDSLSLKLGEVEFHLQVDSAGRILSAGIPEQNLKVERH